MHRNSCSGRRIQPRGAMREELSVGRMRALTLVSHSPRTILVKLRRRGGSPRI